MINKKNSDLTWDKLKTLIEKMYKPHGSYYSVPFLVGDKDNMQIRWFYYETTLKGNQWELTLTSVITLNDRSRCSIRLNPQLDEPTFISKPAILNECDELYKNIVDLFNAGKYKEAQQLSLNEQETELKSLYKSLEHKYLF